MVNLEKPLQYIPRFILSRYQSNKGIKTFVQQILILKYRDPDGTYHGVFPDTGVGICMNEQFYNKTCSSSLEAQLLPPIWLHWRQQEALGLKRNPFDS